LVADLVYGGDEAVKRCTGVVVGEPEGLAIVWIAFLAKDKSEVREGNLGLSWFSMKEPRSVVSRQSDFISLMPLTRLLILPLVDSKACVIQ